MSHISTIIGRIEREIERFDDPMHEGMMDQHVQNLREYTTHWDDATEEELARRRELLDERPWVAESHFTVECCGKDCDFETTEPTEEKAAETAKRHDTPDGKHACFWEHEVEEPATLDQPAGAWKGENQ
jgi:hypothetical protein